MIRRNIFAALFALLLTAPLATSPSSAAVRPWFAGSLGGSTYSMSDVNDDVSTINASLAADGIPLRMDEVSNGLNIGLAFGLELTPRFAIGLGYDRLNAGSDVGDWSGSIEYDLPANFVRAFGRYSFESAGKAKGFVEGSLGRIMSAGSVNVSVTGYGSENADLEGGSLGLEGAGGVALWATPQFAVTGMAGYRMAKVGTVEVDGQQVYNTDGSDYSIDYSGLFVRVGVMVALAP